MILQFSASIDYNTTHEHDVSTTDYVSFLRLKEDSNSQPPKYRISISHFPKFSASAVIQSNSILYLFIYLFIHLFIHAFTWPNSTKMAQIQGDKRHEERDKKSARTKIRN